jgi:hypothetical protein
MKFLTRARALTSGDWWLLWRALVVVALTRAALWVWGVRGARRLARAASRPGPRPRADRLPWAVAAAGRLVPRATCLTQAIALQALLERDGLPSRIEIGVARGAAFQAHAWLVAGNDVVLGGFDASRFERITVMD